MRARPPRCGSGCAAAAAPGRCERFCGSRFWHKVLGPGRQGGLRTWRALPRAGHIALCWLALARAAACLLAAPHRARCTLHICENAWSRSQRRERAAKNPHSKCRRSERRRRGASWLSRGAACKTMFLPMPPRSCIHTVCFSLQALQSSLLQHRQALRAGCHSGASTASPSTACHSCTRVAMHPIRYICKPSASRALLPAQHFRQWSKQQGQQCQPSTRSDRACSACCLGTPHNPSTRAHLLLQQTQALNDIAHCTSSSARSFQSSSSDKTSARRLPAANLRAAGEAESSPPLRGLAAAASLGEAAAPAPCCCTRARSRVSRTAAFAGRRTRRPPGAHASVQQRARRARRSPARQLGRHASAFCTLLPMRMYTASLRACRTG